MKYLIIPIIKLLIWLGACIIYILMQIPYICWNLTTCPTLLNRLIGDRYWCRSHRNSFNSNSFNDNQLLLFKLDVVPNSLFTFLIWLYKYGFDGEITELTEKEEKEYKRYQMNKSCVY